MLVLILCCLDIFILTDSVVKTDLVTIWHILSIRKAIQVF